MEDYYYSQTSIADEFAAKETGFTVFLRTVIESSPWLVASFLIHVVMFSALALLAVGGGEDQNKVDLSSQMEMSASPSPTIEEEEEEEEDEIEEEIEEEIDETEIEEIEEEEEIEGDPEAPSDQPLSDDTIGALGLGAGSPTGAYGKRRGGRRGRAAKKKGGNDFSEQAVNRGLKWLADHQEADGHWDTKKWGGNGDYDPGICGLALLAFAGAGHTERSGKYKRTVQKAIKWLADHQAPNGNFAPKTTMYSHAIPTLALLEEVAMAPVPRTKAIAEKGLKYMVSVQNDYKAWRYWPKDGDNDTSVTTWCVMALKAAKVAGIDVPAGAWAGVKTFLDEVTEPNYGEVGYTTRPIRGAADNEYQKFSMTACGLLCRLYLGMPRENRVIKLGVQILMQNLPEWNQPGIGAPFYYYWYYGSLTLFQVEGESWKRWNTKMRDLLINHQVTTKGELYGSWDPTTQTHFCNMGGRVYSTACAVLTLEVYYRYEIISSKGKKKKR